MYPATNTHLSQYYNNNNMNNATTTTATTTTLSKFDAMKQSDDDDGDDDYEECDDYDDDDGAVRSNSSNNNNSVLFSTVPRSPIAAAHIRLLKRCKSSSSSSSSTFVEYRLRGQPVISYTQINNPQDDYVVVMMWPDGLKANFKGKFKLELSLYSFDHSTSSSSSTGSDHYGDHDDGDGDDEKMESLQFRRLVLTNRWTSDEFSIVSKPGVWVNHQKKKMSTASSSSSGGGSSKVQQQTKAASTTTIAAPYKHSQQNTPTMTEHDILLQPLSITPSLMELMSDGDLCTDANHVVGMDMTMEDHQQHHTTATPITANTNATINTGGGTASNTTTGETSFLQQLGELPNIGVSNTGGSSGTTNTMLLSHMMGVSHHNTGMVTSDPMAAMNERLNHSPHVMHNHSQHHHHHHHHQPAAMTTTSHVTAPRINSTSSASATASSSSSSSSSSSTTGTGGNQFFDEILPTFSLTTDEAPSHDYFSSLMSFSQQLQDPATPSKMLSPNGQSIISETMSHITGNGTFLSLSFGNSSEVVGRPMDSQDWELASRTDENNDRFFERNFMHNK